MNSRHFSGVALPLLALAQSVLLGQSFTISTVFPNPVAAPALGFKTPTGIAVDGAGDIFISDQDANQVFRRNPDGSEQLFAGNGTAGFSGDGGQATAASLKAPTGLAVDSGGNVLIIDSQNNRIRRVDTSGMITTVVGTGQPSTFLIPGQVGTHSSIGFVGGIAADGAGAFYFTGATSIAKVDSSGILSIAVNAGPNSSSIAPVGVAIDGTGRLLVGTPNGIVSKAANGTVSSIASFTYSGGYALAVNSARGVCYTQTAQILCVNNLGISSVLTGNGAPGLGGDGGPAAGGAVGYLGEITFDGAGNLYIADSGNLRIREVTAAGILDTLVKSVATFPVKLAKHVAVDHSGNLFVSDETSHIVSRVAPDGTTVVVAGIGTEGYGGDNVAATASSLFAPEGITVDSLGNLYICESGSHRVRKVDAHGIIHTIAGTGSPGFSGDGQQATSAMLDNPMDVAIDATGNIYIADSYNHRIRRVDTSGVITTVAGSGASFGFGTSGSAGDGGPAIEAQLDLPSWLTITTAGDIYFSAPFSIRRFSPGGIITTFAGSGGCGPDGDGGLALAAHLCQPSGLASDSAGNIYVSDQGNSRVRMIDSDGFITTIAGNGTIGDSGDGGPALAAQFNILWGVAVDSSGNLFIADLLNLRVRRVTGGPRCRITIPTTLRVSDAGVVNDSLIVNTLPSCSYSAISDASWLHINGSSSGTGSGTISYSGDLNAGSTLRSASIKIASPGTSASFYLYQAGAGCLFGVMPQLYSATFIQQIVSAQLNQTPTGCAAWTASSDSPWLTIYGSAVPGVGTQISYQLATNAGPQSRTATLTVGSQTQTIVQDASPITLSSPAAGSTLKCNATFGWTTSGAEQFSYEVLSGSKVLASGTTSSGSVAVSHLPFGNVDFLLWFRHLGLWSVSPIKQTFQSACPANAGVFRAGYFWLEDVDGNQQFNSPPDRAFAFGGVPGDIPITGDWNGSGTSKVGVYRPSNGLFVLDYDGDGLFTAADKAYNLGVGMDPTDVPVVGDWNGDGKTKVGLFRQGFFWILDFNGNGFFEQGTDKTYAFGGVPGDVPIVGDWNGSGTTKIGLFRQGFFWILDVNGNGSIDNVNGSGGDQAFAFGGINGDVPVVGDWNGDGTSKVGVFRAGFFWVLDANGNHAFDGTAAGQDLAFPFGGITGDVPVVGKW